jgi:hypothetical protein
MQAITPEAIADSLSALPSVIAEHAEEEDP